MVHQGCWEVNLVLNQENFSTSALHYSDKMLAVASQQQLRTGI